MFVCYEVVCGTALVFAVIWLLSRYKKRNEDYWSNRGVPFVPGSSIWDTYKSSVTKALHETNIENRKKYGRIYGAFEYGKPVLYVSEPDLIRDILVKDFHIFPNRKEAMPSDKSLQKGLTSLKGNDWKRVRTVVTPAFTSSRMRSMGTIITECTKSLLETFDKHFEKTEPVDCKSVYGAFSVDVVASAGFGMKINSHKDSGNIFVRNAKALLLDFTFKNMLHKSILPSKIVNFIRTESYNALHFFKDVSQKVVQERKQSGKRFNDMLEIMVDALEDMSEDVRNEHSALMQDDVDQFGTVIIDKESYITKNKQLSVDELTSQCTVFFIAGYETTSSILSYLSYCLALNQEWQEKLIKEVDEAFSKNEQMSYDIVKGMKVLDGALSETLRMFPIAARLKRTCNQKYTLRNTNTTIEKGVQVRIPIYPIHYDPEFFDNPHTFNPERFMTSNPRHPQYAYLPFGTGPRSCVGMRFALLAIKICIANILRRYRFRKAPETQVPLKYRKTFGAITVEKLPLAVEKRTDVPM